MKPTRQRNAYACRCKHCGQWCPPDSGRLYAKGDEDFWSVQCDRCRRSGKTHRYDAKPPRSKPVPPCFAALGLNPDGITENEVKSAFRAKVKLVHPDHGGEAREFIALRSHYETALSITQGFHHEHS